MNTVLARSHIRLPWPTLLGVGSSVGYVGYEVPWIHISNSRPQRNCTISQSVVFVGYLPSKAVFSLPVIAYHQVMLNIGLNELVNLKDLVFPALHVVLMSLGVMDTRRSVHVPVFKVG